MGATAMLESNMRRSEHYPSSTEMHGKIQGQGAPEGAADAVGEHLEGRLQQCR